MATWLKQSTAATVQMGPFPDSGDGNTPETGLTITQPDIRLSKNGASFAQKSAAQTLTHNENGWYPVDLSTTDTNTLGSLIVAVHESGALPVWREFMVVPANVYDSLVAGSDTLNADVTQWLGTAAATPSVAGVPEVDLTHVAGATTNVSALATNANAILEDTGTTLPATLATIAGYLDTEIAAILEDTGTTIPGLIAALNDLAAGEVGDAVLDEAVEGSMTLRQATRIVLSALSGLVSGMDTNSPAFRDLADTKDRITATVDAFGNRSAVTLDGS